MDRDTLPLAGLTVLEFGQFVAGPYCAMLLGDMGARVIKIERPHTGELGRNLGGVVVGPERSIFLSLNRNKQSLALDLTQPEGQAIARALAQRADIVVQNLQPGAMRGWGLGHDELRRASPRLIYCAISAFGEEGPYAGLPGIDPLIQAMGGAMALTGEPDGAPTMIGFPVADYAGAMNALHGILLALYARERTGVGSVVTVALIDALIAAMLPREWDYFATGAAPSRMGNAHRQLAPYQAYQTADGWMYVACLDDARFARLAAAMDLHTLAQDPRFATNAARVAHRTELNDALLPRFRARPTHDWLARLRAADLLVAPINELPEAFRDPQVAHNGVVVHTAHPVLGALPSIRPAFRLDTAPDIALTHPPALGAHTDAILAELGYAAGEIATLHTRGVVS